MIEKEKANIFLVTGDGMCRPLATFLEKKGKEYDLSSMWLILSSGMPLSKDVKKILLKYMPRTFILEGLSSSESVAIGANISYPNEEIIDTGIFKPPVTRSIKIINPETGKECKQGEMGEIALCVGDLQAGYYRDEERGSKTWKEINGERYVFPGDMAFIDEKGSLNLIGGGSECTNTGGEKVWPDEVEKIIQTHPKVNDVALVGVPDERWGEAVTAVIQLKKGERTTENEIIDFCRGKMANYKIPKHIIFVDEIPYTAGVYKHAYKKIKELAQENVLGQKK